MKFYFTRYHLKTLFECAFDIGMAILELASATLFLPVCIVLFPLAVLVDIVASALRVEHVAEAELKRGVRK